MRFIFYYKDSDGTPGLLLEEVDNNMYVFVCIQHITLQEIGVHYAYPMMQAMARDLPLTSDQWGEMIGSWFAFAATQSIPVDEIVNYKRRKDGTSNVNG